MPQHLIREGEPRACDAMPPWHSGRQTKSSCLLRHAGSSAIRTWSALGARLETSCHLEHSVDGSFELCSFIEHPIEARADAALAQMNRVRHWGQLDECFPRFGFEKCPRSLSRSADDHRTAGGNARPSREPSP